MTPALQVVRNEPERRFEAAIGGKLALITYDHSPRGLRLLHTEVPEELRGRGIGDKLVQAVLGEARANGEHVIPLCSFVVAWLRRHPGYMDVVAPEFRSRVERQRGVRQTLP